jgi:DNA polymerase
MRCVDPGDDFDSWRQAARGLLAEGVPPGEVIWEARDAGGLFECHAPPRAPQTLHAVPPAFLGLARSVACHADPRRWALLYRLLWRVAVQGRRSLLEIPSDPDVAMARGFEKNVRREIHKMHAFVRFRKCGETEDGRERFVAWFEPEHAIVAAATPFFRKRFANMDWSIFTPKGCAHWIGGRFQLAPGVPADPCDDPDAMEQIWRTYYRSIFNPARLKLKAMQSEMPKRYWKNLPEADLIEGLSRTGGTRTADMLAQTPRPVRPAPPNRYLDHLRQLPDPLPEESRTPASGTLASSGPVEIPSAFPPA